MGPLRTKGIRVKLKGRISSRLQTPVRAFLPRATVEMAKLVVESLGLNMLYSGCGDPVYRLIPKKCMNIKKIETVYYILGISHICRKFDAYASLDRLQIM